MRQCGATREPQVRFPPDYHRTDRTFDCGSRAMAAEAVVVAAAVVVVVVVVVIRAYHLS